MITCSACGAENRDGARFCDACGTALAAVPAPAEQRKTVTVLFCDVQGSTARAERLDPEATRATMARYFETARTAIERHGGTVEKFIGDAVMAVFGVPQVHEDDALRAVRAALELRDAVEIEVRIGVNTGPVVTGGGETLVTGDAVNVAARLEQAAEPGEVLVGAETYGLVRDAVDAELLQPLQAKGKAEPLTAYRLVAITGGEARARRLDAPLVGRTRETRLLADAWDRVCSERACALFTILGAAGVGKSRLAREFLADVDARVVAGRCLAYGEGITYWPVVEIAKQLLDGGEPPNEGVAAVLGETGATTDAIALGIRRLLESSAAERPLVVLIDDVHWGEPAFLDLVEHVADWSRDAPILLFCLARPELLDRRPGWSGGKLNATTVLLEPLDADETQELIDGLLSGDALDEQLRGRILDAAAGNPLFVEEMLAMVDERPAEDVTVPPTIQALLAARLDQLPEPERAALERGAVEGEVFHRGAVQALAPEEPEVASHLLGLVRKELLRPSVPVLPDDDAFRFRHLLIRDAAYDALPKAVRADLHERFADWIAGHGQGVVELDEILGYHLEQACRYRNELDRADAALAERAAARLGEAGSRALHRADVHAAANLVRRAVALLPPDDPAGVRLLPVLGESIYGSGDVRGGRELLAETVERAEALGERRAAAHARLVATFIDGHMGARPIAEMRADLDRAIETLDQFDHELVARAHLTRAWFSFWLGHCGEALRDAGVALEVAERAGLDSRVDEASGVISAAMLQGGTPWPEFMAFIDQRLAAGLGRFGGSLGSDIRNHRPLADAARGEFAAARAGYDELRRDLEERGANWFELAIASDIAIVELRAGDLDAAEQILREAWFGLEQTGEMGFRSTVGTMFAETLAQLGRIDEAAAIADEAMDMASDDDLLTEVSGRRAKALVASARGDRDAAVAEAAAALQVADASDYLEQQVECCIVLGRAFAAAERSDEAVPQFERAISLAEAKGSTVLADQARALLASLTAAA